MIKLILYLVGMAFFLMIYGIYNALTIYYYNKIVRVEDVLYFIKILETIIFLWISHQILKRHIYWKLPLGKSFLSTIGLLKPSNKENKEQSQKLKNNVSPKDSPPSLNANRKY